MRNKKKVFQSLTIFILKILVLIAGHYFFSSRIFYALEQNNLQSAAFYSAIFAGVVLLLLVMFRSSGFFARLFATILGLGAFASILLMHFTDTEPVINTGFTMIYSGIILLGIVLAFFILFKGRE